MSFKNELTDALIGLMESHEKAQKTLLSVCKVDAVDKSTNTIDCTALSDKKQFLGVRLSAVESENKGFNCYPLIGSFVVIALLENEENEAVVVMQSQIEQVALNMNDKFTLELKNDGTGKLNLKKLALNFDELILNDGTNGAMVKLPVLQQEVAKNSAFLMAIRSAIQAAPVTPTDGGASFKAAIIAAISSSQTANLSGAGNDKIKH